MNEKVIELADYALIETYRQLNRIRETNFRLYGESNPWIDARVDELADEIARRELDLDNR